MINVEGTPSSFMGSVGSIARIPSFHDPCQDLVMEESGCDGTSQFVVFQLFDQGSGERMLANARCEGFKSTSSNHLVDAFARAPC